jgi:hypothetical protein
MRTGHCAGVLDHVTMSRWLVFSNSPCILKLQDSAPDNDLGSEKKSVMPRKYTKWLLAAYSLCGFKSQSNMLQLVSFEVK